MFKIEDAYYPETKNYLKEVESCLMNKNLRSATNSLFTAVIVDLFAKLNSSDEEKYNDLLKDISSIDDAGNFNNGYEVKFIKEVHKKTKILNNTILYSAINSLHELRNICSHPYIENGQLKIEVPNEYTLWGIYGNLGTLLFSKPVDSFGSITSNFTDDLKTLSNSDLYTPEEIANRIQKKYYTYLDNDQKIKLCRDLCKFIFNKSGGEYDKNRAINFIALYVLVDDNREQLLPVIESFFNNDYKYQDMDKIDIYFALIYMVFDFPLDSILKNKIVEFVSKYFFLELIYKARFQNNLNNFKRMCEYEQLDTIEYSKYLRYFIKKWVEKLINQFASDEVVSKAIINYFGSAYNFNSAGKIYEEYIDSLVNKISFNLLQVLLDKANSNSQIYFCWNVNKKKLIDMYNNKKSEQDEDVRNLYPNLLDENE